VLLILKASEVHRSMSGGRIMGQIAQNLEEIANQLKPIATVKFLWKDNRTYSKLWQRVSPRNLIKKVIKRSISKGIEF